MTSKATAYFFRKMLITVAFGFSSGLPLALVFGTLSLWLKDYSIAYRTIGAFSPLRQDDKRRGNIARSRDGAIA